MTVTTTRPPVPGASLDLLDRARADLGAACASPRSADRYVAAHLAALRAGAALLAARPAPSRGRPRSVWELLPLAAPDLAEWALFYAASARRRAAAERGEAIAPREADDLLRQSGTFLGLVERDLGLPPGAAVPLQHVALGTA